MRTVLGTLMLSIVVAAQQSPYAGQQDRHIKALSEQQVSELRAGTGMAMALPAELNHYPGPRHVLDMADQLQLSAEQRKAIQAAYDNMHTRAVALGESLLERERQLDGIFRDRDATQERVWELTRDIARLQGELRATHLEAHIATQALLTPEQVNRYDQVRGYSLGEHHHNGQHQH